MVGHCSGPTRSKSTKNDGKKSQRKKRVVGGSKLFLKNNYFVMFGCVSWRSFYVWHVVFGEVFKRFASVCSLDGLGFCDSPSFCQPNQVKRRLQVSRVYATVPGDFETFLFKRAKHRMTSIDSAWCKPGQTAHVSYGWWISCGAAKLLPKPT